VVVLLYSAVKVIPIIRGTSGRGNLDTGGDCDDAGSVASSQISTLMINMQRTFAETVAGIIVDPEIRRLIVLWGLCILPSISRILGRYVYIAICIHFFNG
jgi:hypothetical protein